MGLSVRLLTIVLTIICIAVSAFTCAYISITSGDKAVDKTKETGDTSLKGCFETGQSNIRQRTEDLLNTIAGRTSTSMLSNIKVKVRMGQRIAEWGRVNGVEKINDWGWLWSQRGQLYGEFKIGMEYSDVLGIGIIGGVKSSALLYLEDSGTITRPTAKDCTDVSCWHHQLIYVNNGSDYGPTDLAGRAQLTTANPETAGSQPGIPEPFDHDFGTPGSYAPNPQQTCMPDGSLLKDGFSYGGWCPVAWDPAKETSYKIGGLPPFKALRNIPKWSGAYTKSDLLGLSLMTTHADEYNNYQALTYVPCDARTWSRQLQEMVQEAGMPPRLRVWLDFRSAWLTESIQAMMPTFNQMLADASDAMRPILEAQLAGITGAAAMMNSTGKLLATSHGVPADYVLEFDNLRGFDVPQAKLVMSTQLYPTPAADGTIPTKVRNMYADPTKDVQSDPIIRGVSLKLRTQYTDLQESGRIVLENIDGEGWFVKVSRIDDGNGIDVWCVVAVDYEYMLGEIDRTQQQLVREIETSNKKVQDDLDSDRETMYAIIAVVTVFLIVFSILFTIAITSPLLVLAYEMSAVATMKLEAVDEERPHSLLDEVRGMQISFLKMVENLREYRSYMPQSCLIADESGDEEPEAEDKDDKASKPSKDTKQSMRTSKMESAQSKRITEAAKATLASTEISKKKASFMTLGFCGWHAAYEKTGDKAMVSIHTGLIKNVVGIVAQMKGVPDVFSGDRILVSWGAVRPCGQRQAQMVKTAYTVAMQLGDPAADAVFGCVSGECKAGNMGCDGMKKFTFMSPSIAFVYALERYNRRLGTRILVDNRTVEETTGTFRYRRVDQVSFPKLKAKHDRGHTVFELYAMITGQNEDEWMYQLEEAAKADPCGEWNRLVSGLFDGTADWGTLAASLEETKIPPGALERKGQGAIAANRMAERVASKSAEPATDLELC